MTAASAQGRVPRKDAFAEDKEVRCSFAPPCPDYKGSGYDRGHQAPAADMLHRQHHEAELPADQHDPATAGAQPGGLAHPGGRPAVGHHHKSVQVITGPIFTHSDGAIGNGVTVPHAYYRVVMDLAGKRAIALHPAARERLGQSAGGLCGDGG